jgi:probable F420-dependent oxidoreductase
MFVDASLPPVSLKQVPDLAKAAEKIGFDALWVSETQHSPFLPCALIAEHTQRIGLGTAIAVAFARSPVTMAYTAWDLAEASQGRFILGLGTQVKAHIVRRFGMPWPDSAVGKLREQIAALRAIWHAWSSGEALNFRGEHYKLTLMSPFFTPPPIKYPDIPVYIAGVNTGLARLAGEAADGFHVHPLHSRRYLQEVISPAIEQGASKSGRTSQDVRITVTAFVVTSPEEDLFVRSQIAFYASTPSYRAVMDLHGWQDVAEQLSGLAANGQWGEMAGLIDDQILSAFAVRGPAGDLPSALKDKYQGIADRLGLYIPFVPGMHDDLWRGLVRELRS